VYVSTPFAVPAGEPGKLSVVMVGQFHGRYGSSIPVVVRNNTNRPLLDVEVSGTARGADGTLLASGRSQGFAPWRVNPGEWAIGYVYFSIQEPPTDATFDLTASAKTESYSNYHEMPIVEVQLRPERYGGATLVGIASNPSKVAVSAPNVIAVCFNGDVLETSGSGYGDLDNIPPGGTSSWDIRFFTDAPCTQFAVGAKAYQK
jgi:hypothetical protein